jgi:hypothetical protein
MKKKVPHSLCWIMTTLSALAYLEEHFPVLELYCPCRVGPQNMADPMGLPLSLYNKSF